MEKFIYLYSVWSGSNFEDFTDQKVPENLTLLSYVRQNHKNEYIYGNTLTKKYNSG